MCVVGQVRTKISKSMDQKKINASSDSRVHCLVEPRTAIDIYFFAVETMRCGANDDDIGVRNIFEGNGAKNTKKYCFCAKNT